jgi:hypothetical protein
MHSTNLPFVGKTYLFEYGDFVARDTFISEKEVVYEVLTGPAAGIRGSSLFSARQVSESQYLITWQEDDGGTVVHLDDFEKGLSFSHYTNSRHQFFVMDGRLREASE